MSQPTGQLHRCPDALHERAMTTSGGEVTGPPRQPTATQDAAANPHDPSVNTGGDDRGRLRLIGREPLPLRLTVARLR